MMKWGKKKPTSSSTSHPHLISHVLPLSWLSKFKQAGEKQASVIPNSGLKGKQNFEKPKPKPKPKPPSPKEFSPSPYMQDDDGFWRLSFDEGDGGNGRIEGSQGGTKKRGKKDESLHRTYRRIIAATSELQRELDEVKEGCRRSLEKELPELDLLQVMQMMGSKEKLQETRKRAEQKPSQVIKPEVQRSEMKEEKIKEYISKGVKQRKSFHIPRESSLGGLKHSKVRIRSPRTPSKPESFKIKAIEELKKAKMKRKMKEMAIDEKAAALESFAVVKCSQNPRQDFRESMIEMIIEKRIRRPEELEELLACYLTLNVDEYHDLIIKVFRQVWSELEEDYFNQKEEQYYDV